MSTTPQRDRSLSGPLAAAALKKAPGIDFQSVRQLFNGVHRSCRLGGLDLTYIDLRQPGPLCELLLGPSPRIPNSPHVAGQNGAEGLELSRRGHRTSVALPSESYYKVCFIGH